MLGAFFVVSVAFLGGVFASYFNVVVDRGLKGSVKGRSHCDGCGRTLGVLDLIPVLSVVATHIGSSGKSKCCETSVSLRYFLTEFLGVVSFGLLALKLLAYIELQASIGTVQMFAVAFIVVLTFLFLYLAVEDIWHLEINTFVMFLMIALALLYSLISQGFLEGNELMFSSQLFSVETFLGIVVFPGLILLLIALTKGKGMGLGDFFLMIFIGLTLGVWQTMVAFQLAVYLASIFGIALGLRSGKIKGTIIPLVPFLLIGWQFASIYSEQVFILLFGYNLQNLL
ncbi:MAG: prepilin peptidase [Candidatus Dojkabacteria bacterium]